MKKLLTIICFTLLLSSCVNSTIDFNNSVIIKSVKVSEYDNPKNNYENYCYYTVKGTNVANFWELFSNNGGFYDICGKFQIGDTIKLTK